MPGDKGPEVADLETVKILMHAFPVAGGGCKLILGVGKVVQKPLELQWLMTLRSSTLPDKILFFRIEFLSLERISI